MNTEDKIIQKLLEHDQRFEKIDSTQDLMIQKLMEHDQRFEKIDSTQDLMIQKLMEHEIKLEGFATNERVDQLERNITSALEKQLVILQRLDQERIFTTEWIRRIEKDVETVKLRLQVA